MFRSVISVMGTVLALLLLALVFVVYPWRLLANYSVMDVVLFLLLATLSVFFLVILPYYLGEKTGILTIKLFSPTRAGFKTPSWTLWGGWVQFIGFIFGLGIVVVTVMAFQALEIPTTLPLPEWSPFPEIPPLTEIPIFLAIPAFTVAFLGTILLGYRYTCKK